MQEKTTALRSTCLQGLPDVTLCPALLFLLSPSPQHRQAVKPAILTRLWQRLQQKISKHSKLQKMFSKHSGLQPTGRNCCAEGGRDHPCVLHLQEVLSSSSPATELTRWWSKGQTHPARQFCSVVSPQAGDIENTVVFVWLGEKCKPRASVTGFVCMY